MGFVSGGIAVATGVLFIAGLLLRPKADEQDGLGKDQPKTISTRGTIVPMTRGTRKTTQAVIGWAGKRQVNEDDGGGKSGKGGAGGSTYREEVWHILGVGPASGLFEIRFNGKVRWQGNVTPDNTPSGSTISTGTVGSFTIYWGEPDQPINTFLGTSDRVGISSRWPRICYVVWDTMRYGSSPAQPQVEYVMDWSCQGLSLDDSNFILDSGGARGINPAHLLHELLTTGPFTGAGHANSMVDDVTLEQMGVDLQAEHLPMNVEYRDGTTVETAVQAILQDTGYQMPEVDGRLAFLPMRYDSGATYVSLDDKDIIVAPGESIDYKFGNANQSVAPVFTFDNETDYNYDTQDVSFVDDGDVNEVGLVNASRVPLTTVTNDTVASEVARRRWQEISIDKRFTLSVLRGGRLIVPGQVVTRSPYGNLRVLGVKWSDESPVTEVSCAVDTYGVPDINEVLVVPDPGDGVQAAAADLAFAIFQRPSEFQVSQEKELYLFRVRAHNQITSARTRTSSNNVDYFFSSPQIHQQGGTLEEAIDIGASSPIAEGPEFEPLNDDIYDVLDLSSDSASHEAGRQLALINSEMFYVQYFDIVNEEPWQPSESIPTDGFVRPTSGSPNLRFKADGAGTTGVTEPDWPEEVGDTVSDNGITWTAHRFAFKPMNMIRARMGSSAAAHSIGDTIFIADRLDLVQVVHPGWGTGSTAYVKTAPYNDFSEVDISTVTAKSIVLT